MNGMKNPYSKGIILWSINGDVNKFMSDHY